MNWSMVTLIFSFCLPPLSFLFPFDLSFKNRHFVLFLVAGWPYTFDDGLLEEDHRHVACSVWESFQRSVEICVCHLIGTLRLPHAHQEREFFFWFLFSDRNLLQELFFWLLFSVWICSWSPFISLPLPLSVSLSLSFSLSLSLSLCLSLSLSLPLSLSLSIDIHQAGTRRGIPKAVAFGEEPLGSPSAVTRHWRGVAIQLSRWICRRRECRIISLIRPGRLWVSPSISCHGEISGRVFLLCLWPVNESRFPCQTS